ncbi:hypothetical protein ACO0SA_003045 [Hanseniaspora valbyensis]
MIVSRNNLRYNRQGSKDSTSTIASSKSSNSQRGGITSNNNSIHQLYTLRNRSNNATTSNNNFNPNHNLNYLLYEIPEQYSRANSSISTNSDLISARPPNIRNNSSENKIKIVIKNSDDNPFNNNNNNNGIFKSNYQINFNSSCHNNNKNNNNNNGNNSGSNGKRPHLFSSNGSSTSLSQKSNSSSKQSMSPNSLYSPQLNQVKTGSTSLLTDQHNLTRAITNSNNNSNNNIIMSRNNNNNNSNSNNNNSNNKFYDEFTLKNNASFLDSISSLNENKNINENGFKSNISKQLRINQKMSHLKNNMEKKDVFANENEKYFYSDVKFINDEINQQYKNLKKQTFTTVGKESEKCFVTNKYNDIILRDEDISNNSSSNKKLDSEKTTVSENDSSMITPDLLTKLATKVWEEAEKL